MKITGHINHNLIRDLAEEEARAGEFKRRLSIGDPKNIAQRAYAEAFDTTRKLLALETVCEKIVNPSVNP